MPSILFLSHQLDLHMGLRTRHLSQISSLFFSPCFIPLYIREAHNPQFLPVPILRARPEVVPLAMAWVPGGYRCGGISPLSAVISPKLRSGKIPFTPAKK